MNDKFESCLRRVLHGSLQKAPEEMLEDCLKICIELTGASGGSIFGEEGPYLQFLFSNVPSLIGMKVPWDSIAGNTARHNVVIYTYAPADKRHYDGVDAHVARQTRYLLSVPIPSIHSATAKNDQVRSAGVLQLLFDDNILPQFDVTSGAREFSLESMKEQEQYDGMFKEVFWILPNISFGLEVMRLRQTSYQCIHELKNKLVATQSWLVCLKQDLGGLAATALEDEAVVEDFSLAEGAAREGASLAKSYLQFTKIYSPKYEDTDIGVVLRQTSADLRAFASEEGGGLVQIVTEVADGIPVRSMDPGQMKMALFNLGKNATEALVEHRIAGAEVKLRADMNGDRLRVVVRDNGPGMPEEIASNLFVAFKTKKAGGTGLGLTITKKIVDVHGGRIWCDTGKTGTSFTIEL